MEIDNSDYYFKVPSSLRVVTAASQSYYDVATIDTCSVRWTDFILATQLGCELSNYYKTGNVRINVTLTRVRVTIVVVQKQ